MPESPSCYDVATGLSLMSAKPGQYNILVQRRADYRIRLEFEDANGDPINLTGWTVYAQVWDKGRTTKYADFTVEYTDRVNGAIHISLNPVQTAGLPCESFYDVMLQDTAGLKQYYLEGIVYISEGYTAP